MAIIATTEDMKRDIEELANIAIEDKISTSAIRKYYEMSHQKLKGSLEDAVEHDLAVSDITGIKIMSDRFSDKLLETLSKYKQYKERKLLLECTLILVNHTTEIKSNET